MSITINNEVISEEVVQTEQVRLQQSGNVPHDVPEEELLVQAKDNVIFRTLLKQEAKKTDVKINATAIEDGVEQLVEDYGGRDSFLERCGMTEGDMPKVHEHIEENLRIEALFDGLCKDIADTSDEEASTYYSEHVNDFILPPQIKVSHIVKQPQQNPEETYQEMLSILKKLKGGAKFADVANENSDCSQEPGGELGVIVKGKMVEEFDAVAFSIDVNEISPIFMTQFGYHILMVSEKYDTRQRPLDEVKDEIKDIVKSVKQDELVNEYVQKLRDNAKIVESK